MIRVKNMSSKKNFVLMHFFSKVIQGGADKDNREVYSGFSALDV